jgi:hypothetical protein
MMNHTPRFRLSLSTLAAIFTLGLDARADVVTLGVSNTPSAGGYTSTGVYNPLSIYSEPGGYGVAFLLPPVPLALPLGGGGSTSAFMTGLEKNFNADTGWDFTPAANNLPQNSLVINADQVAGGPSYPCFLSSGDCVGIYGKTSRLGFVVSYTGTPIANGHWIQVVSTNSPASGQTSPYVDNLGSTRTPYYDVPFTANASVFLDASSRNPTVSQYWLGNLYYASGGLTAGSEANPADVTIYNGLEWGWADIFVDTASFAAFSAAVSKDLNSVASLDTALDGNFNAVLDQAEVSQIDSEFIAAAVPEPPFTILLFACLAVIASIRALRRIVD